MRTLMLVPAALTILALTAVTGFSGASVGNTEPGAPTGRIQKHDISSGGVGAIGQSGFLRGGTYRLAKGDMSGMGGGGGMGKGGMKGDMMGGMGKGKDKKG